MTHISSNSNYTVGTRANHAVKSDSICLPPRENTQAQNDACNETGNDQLVTVTKKKGWDGKMIFTNIRTILYALVFGILFGFLMNKGTVFVAPTIRMQFIFRRFAMLKMFLAAVGASMLSIVFLGLVCEKVYGKVFDAYVEHNSRRDYLHFIFGGTLIGFGMVVCGSCPGTVFVQVGSGILNALLTCLGGLIGTYFYYILVHDRIAVEKLPPMSLVLRRLPDLIHVHSSIVRLVLGIAFLGIAIGLEFVVPWKNDLNPGLLSKGTVNPEEAVGHIFGMAAWPPSACGAGVGLLQLLFVFFLEKSLGISSAFTVCAAQICYIKPIGRKLPTLSAFTSGVKNYVAIVFALGAICGSAVSSGLAQTLPLGAENGTNALNSICGGFLLLLGARCAGGCTSGQGISGTTHLLIGSFISTAGIFGGGILFAYTYSLSNREWLFQNL